MSGLTPNFVEVMKDFFHKKQHQLIEKMPKILLHTHLEGSIPLSTLLMLCKRNEVNLPFPAKSDFIENMCRSGGWPTFRSIFLSIASCFKTRFDFHDAVVDYARRLARENVLYAELHCTPWVHLSRGIALDVIAEGLYSGIEAARKELKIQLKVICDLVRNPAEDAWTILSWMRNLPRSHFVALGISGRPGSVPLIKFQKCCERARDYGLRVVAHLGELEGSFTVRIGVEHLQVDRVCHGVRVLEDNQLLSELVSRQIHFELCPTSNDVLGIGQPGYRSIGLLLTSGAACSINTDDEILFNTSLTKELLILLNRGIIRLIDIIRLQKNAAHAAFICASEREQIVSTLDKACQKLYREGQLSETLRVEGLT